MCENTFHTLERLIVTRGENLWQEVPTGHCARLWVSMVPFMPPKGAPGFSICGMRKKLKPTLPLNMEQAFSEPLSCIKYLKPLK